MDTPPPPLSVVEPPTPLHGARFDGLHSRPVRRSPRISKQQHNRTPSPSASRASPISAKSSPRSKNHSRIQTGASGYSPPSSPISPPRMQRTKPRKTAHQPKQTEASQNQTLSTSSRTSMLPTPVKTPRKKDVKQTVTSTGRVLFPQRPDSLDNVMPNPRKRSRKGLSLESFTENDGEDSDIKIFTDSRDKMPELDQSADNPFYANPGPSGRNNKKSKPKPARNEAVQNALEHDEGMVYVFRGKKIYRKFEDIDYDEPEGGSTALDDLPVHNLESPKPFKRASVKPRFLFGKNERAARYSARKNATAHNHLGNTTDEEAVTDIEEGGSSASESAEAAPEEVFTPRKAKVIAVPATPPTTTRKRVAFHDPTATEVHTGDEANGDTDPRITIVKARRPNPFDGWARTKNGSGSSASGATAGSEKTRGKKRTAEEAGPSEDRGKRMKSAAKSSGS